MDKARKKDLIIKLCCFIAAFALWLYIANIENPIRTTVIKNVRVNVINKEVLSQYNLVQLPNQDYNINITVKGAANEIYSLKPSQFSLEADMSAYALKKGKMRIPVQIKQSPDNVTIINPEALWVKVEIDDFVQKNVPVKADIKGEVKEGYSVLEPLITPGSVLISGASKYVDLVDHVSIKVNINNEANNIEQVYAPKPVDSSEREVEFVKVEPREVRVKIPLDKTKYVPVEANVKSAGGNSITSVSVIPENVGISGDPNVLKGISKINTEEIDLSRISNEGTIDVGLRVPDKVKLLNGQDKVKVKVLFESIEQKNLTLDVKVMGLDEKYDSVLEKKQVSLIVSGPKDKIDSLKGEDIECYIDLKDLKEGNYNVPLNINLPDSINKISYNPQTINVNIKIKEASEVNAN